jgi:hypothetical protein
LLRLFAALAVLGTGARAAAGTVTFTGNNSRSWGDPGNWSGNAVPTSTDNVVFDGSIANSACDIDTNVDCASILIQGSYSKDVAPTGNQTMRVRGNVTLNSSSSQNSLTVSTGATQIDGTVTVAQGSFLGNGGTLHIIGGLSLSGGKVTLNTGTTQIDGNVSESGGTFAAGSGLLEIGGDLGPLSGGSFTASSMTTWIGGAFNRSSVSNTFSAAKGDLLFNATSAKTHTFNGAILARVVFNDGLVGYWNLDDGSGTTATDQSDYGNTGTTSNLTWGTSSGPGLVFRNVAYGTFNGSSSQISATVANLPAANAAQTISVWASIAALPASASSMVALTGAASAVKLGLSSTQLRVLRNDGTALISTAAPSTGSWHHIAYTWDGSNNRLYVDGVAVTPTAVAHDTAAVSSAFIGATNAGADFFNGSLDEVRVYNRALGARDIAALALGRMPSAGVATHTITDGIIATNGRNIGDFVIASGTLTGSGTIQSEGSWLNYGGRYTGTGLVTLTSASARFVLSGGETFSSLTVNSNSVYTLADRLWVSGTLTMVKSLSLNDGGYVAHAGTFATTVTNGYQASTGTVVLDGRSNQTITATTFNNLRVEAPNESTLAGYWKLDEGQGAVARDFSANGNSGTVSTTGATGASPPTTIGFDDAAAMKFDGSAGYVSAGATGLPAANAAQSISAWVNISALPGTASSVVALTGASSAVKLGLSSSNLRVLRNDGTALIQTTAPSTGAWHHVAYTFDGTNNNLYVDGVAVTATTTAHDAGAVTGAFIGASSASADFFNGMIDDVRVYSAALTATQVARLVAGTYAGTGVGATVTLGSATTVGNTLALDAGGLSTGAVTLGASLTTSAALINSGTYTSGSAAQSFSGGLTVQSGGTLAMATSGGSVQIASGKVLTMDGTLTGTSTGSTIRSVSGTYTFKVGSTSTARPTLNITGGLAVQNTDAGGMQVNANHSAITTFTRFDNVVFTAGTTTFLNIYATNLYVNSNGCRFGISTGGVSDASLPTNNVTLTGNGTADGETRALFGAATCAASKTTAGYCQHAWASDDDPDGNGIGNTPASNGAVVQYIRAAESDTAGTVVGLPTAAFDWNTFTYYSTYVAYNNASGTSSVIYVRDTSGNPKYSWTAPAGETIVGTPRWNTISGAHYLFVAMASGKVYRLVDNASSSLVLDAGWSTNPYNCGCTIVTPLGMDTSNLYWGGTQSGAQALWTLGQTSEAQPMGSPFSITPTITTASPALWVDAQGKTNLFLAVVGHLLEVNVTNQTLAADNSDLGTASVFGRIAFGTRTTNRVLAGDDAGNFWSIDPANFAGTTKQWSYTVASDQIKSSPFYDYPSDTIIFGTEAGKVVSLSSAGAAGGGYPFTPGASSDAVRSAPFYASGVLLVGTTTGKLFVIDRNNGSAPALITEYHFGPTEGVSGIGFDGSTNRYMVSTSDATNKDGRLYYIDLVADPTSGSS